MKTKLNTKLYTDVFCCCIKFFPSFTTHPEDRLVPIYFLYGSTKHITLWSGIDRLLGVTQTSYVGALTRASLTVDVMYALGRHGYWPARYCTVYFSVLPVWHVHPFSENSAGPPCCTHTTALCRWKTQPHAPLWPCSTEGNVCIAEIQLK